MVDDKFKTDYDGRLHIGAPSRGGQLTLSRASTSIDGESKEFISVTITKMTDETMFSRKQEATILFPVECRQKLIDWLLAEREEE